MFQHCQCVVRGGSSYEGKVMGWNPVGVCELAQSVWSKSVLLTLAAHLTRVGIQASWASDVRMWIDQHTSITRMMATNPSSVTEGLSGKKNCIHQSVLPYLWFCFLRFHLPCQDFIVFRHDLTVGKSNSLASEISLMIDIEMYWHLGVSTLIVERI